MSDTLTRSIVANFETIILPLLGEDAIMQGEELVALNPHRDDKHLGSFRFNVNTGQWADFALTDVSTSIEIFVEI